MVGHGEGEGLARVGLDCGVDGGVGDEVGGCVGEEGVVGG